MSMAKNVEKGKDDVMANKIQAGGSKCQHPGCKKRAFYNFEGEKNFRFCPEHKMEGMVDLKHKKCEHSDSGCRKMASFNYKGKQGGRFCSKHKLDGMFDVKSRACEHTGCTKRAAFNFEGVGRGRFCVHHKLQDMVDVQRKRCEFAGCSRKAGFNFPGQKSYVFCSQHKAAGMVDVKNKIRCEHPDCGKRANYGFQEGKGGIRRFCAEHKMEGMVDLLRRECEQTGCSKGAAYNFEGNVRKGRYCANHKLDGMVDVVVRRCEKDGCRGLLPAFAYEGEVKGRFCTKHKLKGMVNVRNNTRLRQGPFARKGTTLVTSMTVEGSIMLCGPQKGEGKMVKVKGARAGQRTIFDLKECEAAECTTRPSFQYQFQGERGARFCKKHKLRGMVNVKKSTQSQQQLAGGTSIPITEV